MNMIPSPSLEVRDLRLVWAIAESGGATAAGRLLGLSQSAVSHQLKQLEAQLGFEVFERAGRGLQITGAGASLLLIAKRVVTELAHNEAQLRSSAGELKQVLRLTTHCHTAYHWLAPVVGGLLDAYPNVELKLVPEATRDPFPALERRELDLALTLTRYKNSAFRQRRLFADELVVVVGPQHRLASQRRVDPEQLVDEQLILYDVVPVDRALVLAKLFPNGGGFRRVMRVPLTEVIVELVSKGVGISILARWTVAERLASGALVALPLTVGPLRRQWFGIYPAAHPAQDAIRYIIGAFARHAKQVIG